MIGKVVTGRTYDPETYEISLRQVTAKVIDVGMATCRFWPNDSQEPLTFPIDVLFCAPSDGLSFDATQVVRIPFYLLTEIQGASVDISLADLVVGPPTKFTTDNLEDFTEDYTATGGIVARAKCPVIFWENSFHPRVVGFSDYLVCYPLVSQDPLIFDSTNLLFFQEVKAEFVNPTFVGPTGGTGGSGGSGGIQGLVAGPGIGISVVGATATISNLFNITAGPNISISGSYPSFTISAIIPPPGPSFQYFVQPTAPLVPLNVGDRWFNTTIGSEFVWIDDGNSSQWVEISGDGTGLKYYVSPTPPVATLVSGDRWFNTTTGDEFVWIDDGNSAQWVQIIPDLPPATVVYVPTTITSSTASLSYTYNYYGVNYNGAVDITMPVATGNEGKVIVIKDEGGYCGNPAKRIRLTGNGGELIDGYNYVDMNISKMGLQLLPRGGEWHII